MEIITAYKANDGMIFGTKEECLEHNLYLKDYFYLLIYLS